MPSWTRKQDRGSVISLLDGLEPHTAQTQVLCLTHSRKHFRRRSNLQWFFGEVGHQQHVLTIRQRDTTYTATLIQVTYQVRQISLDRRAHWL